MSAVAERVDYAVEPATVGGVLAAGWLLASHHFGALVAAAFWPTLFGALGTDLVDLADRLTDRIDPLVFLVATVVGTLIQGLGESFAFVRMAGLSQQAILHQEIDAAPPRFALVATRVWPLIALNIIGILASLPLLIVLPLAIFVWVRWGVADVIVALEPVGPLEAFRKSWRLVRGSWWHVFGIVSVSVVGYGLIAVGLSGAIDAAMPYLPFLGRHFFVRSVIESLPLLVTAPLGVATLVVLYHELQSREADK